MTRNSRARRPWWTAAVVAVVAGTVVATGGSASQATGGSRPAVKGAAALAAGALKVDSFAGPIGVGAAPLLSWNDTAVHGARSATTQSAYQVRVASSRSRLNAPDLWNSGKVRSSSTSNVAYAGKRLGSRKQVVWDVRVWDAAGRASAWSAPSSWQMGLLSASAWSAKWIEDPSYTYAANGVPNPLPVFAKSFTSARNVTSARLYVTGLGQYVARLNGKPVTRAVLEPGQTSYWSEVDYRTYDVTTLLRRGSNVIGLETGSGAYQQADSTSAGRYMFQPGNNTVLGSPKVVAQLEITYAGGRTETIATNASWLTRSGDTTFSSWWGGEDYDATRMQPNWTSSSANLRSAAWQRARVATLTSSTIPRASTPLVADPRPPVTVARTAHPVKATKISTPAATTTLVGPASSGDTVLHLATVANVYAGDKIKVGDGATQATRTVTRVGTAASSVTTTAVAAAVGDTVLKVTDVGTPCNAGGACVGTSRFVVGQHLVLGTGTDANTYVVKAVGTSGAGGTGVMVSPALRSAASQGTSVQGAGSGITVSAPLSNAYPGGTAAVSVPGPAYVLDFGANLAGLPAVTGRAPRGTTVTMIPAEVLNTDGSINVSSTGASATSQILYRYTFRGQGREQWHAQFTYNGFRYLEVHGLGKTLTPQAISLLVTHASNASTATFSSSDPMLNQIYTITKRALDNNMQSVLTDCPDREKGPYTGDNVQDVETDLTLYDMQSYERQLVANMRTSQRPTPLSNQSPGLIANIAPEYHIVPPILFGRDYLDEPNWAKAVVVIPWELYQVYGDTRVMRENYSAMVKWMAYEARNKAENNGNIPGLGDWVAPQATDEQPVRDYGYYVAATTMAKIAKVLGRNADVAKYAALADDLRQEYNTKYLHTDSSGNAWYANNTEASNAIALDADGLVPSKYRAAVLNSLVLAVQNYGYRLGTGSVALGPLFRTLHAAGRDDLIYRMVTNPVAPSYAYLVNQGATTLEENLLGTGGSKDHQFLGEVAGWLVHDVVGIDQAPGSLGYKQLLVKPALVGTVTHMSGSYSTPQGVATAQWTRSSNGAVTLSVTIPANTTAKVFIPVSANTTSVPSGQYTLYSQGGHTYEVHQVTSGAHTFRITP